MYGSSLSTAFSLSTATNFHGNEKTINPHPSGIYSLVRNPKLTRRVIKWRSCAGISQGSTSEVGLSRDGCSGKHTSEDRAAQRD